MPISIKNACLPFLVAAVFFKSTLPVKMDAADPFLFTRTQAPSKKDVPASSLEAGLLPFLNQIEENDLLNNFDEALHLIDQLLEEETIHDSLVEAYLLKKKLWLSFKQGNDEQVVKMAEIRPGKDPYSLLIYAAALRNLDRFKEADAILEKLLLQEDLAKDQFLLEKGNLLLKAKRYAEAEAYFEEALSSSGSRELAENASLKRAVAAFLAQDHKKAALILKSLRSSQPSDPLLISLLAYLNAKEHMLHGNTALALSSFQESLEQKIPDELLKPLLAEYGNTLTSFALEKSDQESEKLFMQADQIFLRLMALGSEEEGLIGRGNNLLAQKISSIGSEEGGEKEQQMIISLLKIPSAKAAELALLLQAESEGDFKKKNESFLLLLKRADEENRAPIAILHGFHLVRWAAVLNQEGFTEESVIRFKEGTEALTLFMNANPASPLFAKAAISFVKAAIGAKEKLTQAKKLLAALKDKDIPEKNLAKAYEALLALEAGDKNASVLLIEAYQDYEASLKESPNNPTLKEARFIIASSFYRLGDSKKAKEVMLHGSGAADLTALLPEELYLSAFIAEQEGLSAEKRAFLTTLLEKKPDHPLAKEAWFKLYTLKEYLSGGKMEMKHLEQFVSTWKDSPRTPLAYYLIGLDYKQDRKSAEGRWIRKKSLTKAIEAFTKATSSFRDLEQKQLIPKDQLEPLTLLSFNAELEAGLANFAIAKESKAAKREVYLEYSKEIFDRLASSLKPKAHHLLSAFKGWPLYMDAKLLLAETEIELGSFEGGKRHLSDVLEYLQSAGIQKGYYFSKAHYLAAGLSIQNGQYKEGMDHLLLAEQDDTGFTTEEKLAGAIKKGLCLKSLGRLDEAMNVFSSVVNADAVSSLRVQAMLERAYIYKDQNRLDLYRKQLEALERMGGKWHAKAQQLLEEQYEEYRHQ